MAGENEQKPTEQQPIPFNFSKGVVKNEGAELSNMAESLRQLAKPNPPVAAAPEIVAPKVEKPAEPLAEEKIQVSSEIETPIVEAPKPEVKKGKKSKEQPKSELPEIVGADGKPIEITTFSEGDNKEFLESIGIQSEQPKAEGEQPKEVEKKGKKVELPKDVTERLSLLEAENKQLKSDPAYNVAKELIGKDKNGIKELVKKFDLTDYTILPPKDIYEIDLKSQGLEGDELAEALAEFEDLPSYKQKTLTNPIRSKLQERADESFNIASNAPSEKQIREQVKYQQEATENALAALDDLCEKVGTKGYNGWKPKEDDLAIIRNGVEQNTVISLKDGKPYYDVKASFDREVWMNPEIRNKILKHSYELGKYSGYEDFIKERIRVNPKDFVPGSQGGKPTYSFNNSVKPAQNGQTN